MKSIARPGEEIMDKKPRPDPALIPAHHMSGNEELRFTLKKGI